MEEVEERRVLISYRWQESEYAYFFLIFSRGVILPYADKYKSLRSCKSLSLDK